MAVSWTFTVSSTYSGLTGHTGTQSFNSGGLADAASNNANANSIWGSAAGTGFQYITADFGEVVTLSQIVVASAWASALGGWGASYTNGAQIHTSTDGSTWTLLTTLSVSNDNEQTINVGPLDCRYVRASKTNQYLALGTFKFNATAGTEYDLGAGALSITGHAPSLATAFAIGPGHLALTGHAPDFVVNTFEIGAGHLVIAGHAPSVEQSFLIGDPASLILAGYAPTVSAWWAAQPTPESWTPVPPNPEIWTRQ